MGFLNKLFGKAEASINRVSGRTDLLEGMCAIAALAAAADGSIADDEIATAVQVVENNETLSSAFNPAQINDAMNKQIKRANGGFSGKATLWKEVGDIAGNKEDAEAVFLIALDVVHADGQVDPKEQAILDKAAKLLGVNQANYV